MAFTKGQSGNPKGRPAGAKDKSNSEIKEYYHCLLEGNLSNIDLWLKEVAVKDPAKAFELVLKLSEFILPKMKVADITGSIDMFPPPRTLTKDEARELWADLENGNFKKIRI